MMKPEDLVNENKWEAVVKESFPVAVANQYSYGEAMQIAAHIFWLVQAIDGKTERRICDSIITLLSILSS